MPFVHTKYHHQFVTKKDSRSKIVLQLIKFKRVHVPTCCYIEFALNETHIIDLCHMFSIIDTVVNQEETKYNGKRKLHNNGKQIYYD